MLSQPQSSYALSTPIFNPNLLLFRSMETANPTKFDLQVALGYYRVRYETFDKGRFKNHLQKMFPEEDVDVRWIQCLKHISRDPTFNDQQKSIAKNTLNVSSTLITQGPHLDSPCMLDILAVSRLHRPITIHLAWGGTSPTLAAIGLLLAC
ncbi:hypothetical protein BGX38DRAFT_1227562 [Terfezia claveryi]|nr:hypothetical protein BGX38DRAFT_1227562 [Terfezia claveryi]